MPLKLIPPRKGKSPFYSVRGTHLGQYVDRSTKLADKAKARLVLKKWEAEIERGELSSKKEMTFAQATRRYIVSGGEDRFLKPIVDHLGPTATLRSINQEKIDEIAATLYPLATQATRNRQVYTPISAILKQSGNDYKVRRPLGAGGSKRTKWLWPDEANRLFEAAGHVDAEFRTFLITLCYTGIRLSEGLGLQVRDVRLAESFAYIPTSKNDEPRAIFLNPFVVATLANHPRGMDRIGQRVFRFNKSGHLYKMLKAAKTRAGSDLGWVGFHTMCHTWATWMRRYGGLDTRGLVGTGRWKDQKSAARYEHVVVSEEARKALLLPTPDGALIRDFGGIAVESEPQETQRIEIK